MALARLVYVSTARPGLDPVELEEMLAAARARNGALSITGLLVYNGVNFMQALEGPGDAVAAVYDSIARDPRHTGPVAVLEEHVETRAFPGWSMAYAVLPDPEGAADALRVPPGRISSLLPETAGAELALLFTSFNTMNAV